MKHESIEINTMSHNTNAGVSPRNLNVQKQLSFQGVKHLRYARTLELQAYDVQMKGLIQQARGIAKMRKGALVAMAGLQKIELAVSATENEDVHTFLRKTAGHLIKQMPQGRPDNVTEATDTIAEMAAKQAAVLGQQAGVSTAVEAPNEFQGCRETLPVPISATSCEYPRPSFIRPDGIQEETGYLTVVGRTTKVCPQAYCKFEGSRETVNAHIRKVHTKEVLLCPNRDMCKYDKGPMRTFNTEVMSRHYRKEGPLHPDVHQAIALAPKGKKISREGSPTTRSRDSSPGTSTGVKKEPK